MTLSVKHAFTSAKADGGDATLVRPSNWNAEHTLTAAINKVLGTDGSSTTVQELSCTSFGRTTLASTDLADWISDTSFAAANFTWTGISIFGNAFHFSAPITPTALAVDTNDWAPSSFSVANRIRMSASSAINLTGLTAGTDGRKIELVNIGAFTVTLKAQSNSSAGANRFAMPSDIALRQHEMVSLTYDGSSTIWRVEGYVPRARTPTMQDLTSGTAATYTTPSGCTRIRIRAVGGGGAGGGGTAGSTTSFNSIVAAGGSAGAASSGATTGTGGAGGTGGTGTADLRIPGGAGGRGTVGHTAAGVTINASGGNGGGSMLAGGPGSDIAASANTGCGGAAIAIAAVQNQAASGGGGAGEYFELTIGSPAATYTYTVGAGGVGSGTTSGASGRIIVEEFYD